MKFSAAMLLALFSLTVLFSCKKDNDKKKSIEGLWEGTYVNDASGNTFFYSFNIKPGGVIEEIDADGDKIGQGTWELENNIFSATYSWPNGLEFSVLASYYPDQTKLLGNWGYDDSVTDGGTWEMTPAQ